MGTIVIISGQAESLVRFRGHLIRRMVEAGHRVVAMSHEAAAPAGLAALGATYEQCALQRATVRPDQDLRAMVRLAARLRQLRPMLVLGYNVKPVIYGMLAARLARVPHRAALVTGLGYLFIDDGSRRQRLLRAAALPLYRLALSGAHTLIMQNQDDAADLRTAGVLASDREVVIVAGSGVDLGEFPELPVPPGPPVFLFVGRLLGDKGVREFVAASRAVAETAPDVRFVLVGPRDPNPSGVTREEVDGWERERIVEVVGGVDDVRPFLHGSTVFVLPSYREGTPRSVLEAMATGRAVITTDAPGCRETVQDGVNGRIVPVADAPALAAAMQHYVTDPNLAVQHGRAGRVHAVERYDVHKVNAVMLRALRVSPKDS